MPTIPTPQVPWWADPKGSSVVDSLPVTLARKATGLLGLDDPSAATMGVAAPMSAVGEAPGGLIQSLLKYAPTKNAEATGELLKTLLGFKGEASKAIEMPHPMAPKPTTYSNLFQSMLSRNPDLQDTFEYPVRKELARPRGLPIQYDREAAVKAAFKPNFDDQIARPTISTQKELPPLSVRPTTGSQNGAVTARFAKSGLDANTIRQIRGMSIKDASTAFPDMNPSTLRGIISRDSYGWLPDKD